MRVQEYIGLISLIMGLIYAAILLYKTVSPPEELRNARGSLFYHMVSEFIVYLLCAMGLSDFLLNTLAIKKSGTVEDKYIPDNLIACCIVPGAVIAYFYLRQEGSVEPVTLVAFIICLIIGSAVGSGVVSRLDGGMVKKVMGVCLLCSIALVIVKMIVSSGASGTDIGFRGFRLYFLCLLAFGMGFANMMGIPMKPTATALLLILGMSPLTTLTMILVMGCVTPLSGGIRVVKTGKYNKKMVLSAVTSGCAGACLGTALAVSIPAAVLNVILIVMMGIAAASMLKKQS